MKLQAFILQILFAVSCTSYHIPDCKIVKPQDECNNVNHSITSEDYVAVIPRDTHLTHRTHLERSRTGSASLSSEPALSPYTKSENSTNSTTTLSIQQPSLNGSAWMLRLEGIITPIFRTVILLLTLFNINITWRIHGQWMTLVSYQLGRTQLTASQPSMSYAIPYDIIFVLLTQAGRLRRVIIIWPMVRPILKPSPPTPLFWRAESDDDPNG